MKFKHVVNGKRQTYIVVVQQLQHGVPLCGTFYLFSFQKIRTIGQRKQAGDVTFDVELVWNGVFVIKRVKHPPCNPLLPVVQVDLPQRIQDILLFNGDIFPATEECRSVVTSLHKRTCKISAVLKFLKRKRQASIQKDGISSLQLDVNVFSLVLVEELVLLLHGRLSLNGAVMHVYKLVAVIMLDGTRGNKYSREEFVALVEYNGSHVCLSPTHDYSGFHTVFQIHVFLAR